LIRILAIALLFLPASALAVGEREKVRLEAVREQRLALEKQVKDKESARNAAQEQLRATEKNIAASARKLHALTEEHAGVRSERSAYERDLKIIEARVATRQAELSRLLRYRFRPQEADALAILLSGGDPNAAKRDRYFLSLLSRAKADLISGLRADAAETRRLADMVRQRSEKLAALAQREEAERALLRQRQQERQETLARLAGQIASQRHEIDTLKQNEQRLGNLITTLAKKAAQARKAIQAKKATQAKAAAQARQPAPALPSPLVRSDPINARGAFVQLRGRLLFPVAGSRIEPQAARRDADQAFRKGLFIKAGEGAEVRAVAAGVVVFADWLRGYGHLLIVDHDDDFFSVYGNNQTLLADVGQQVQGGKPIAIVGASGGYAESGLYFELRHRGQAIDAAKWLRTLP
jgi:septal ring factor EnvC (AmiA/AmiB activator)